MLNPRWLWGMQCCCGGPATPDAYCVGGHGGNSSPFAHLLDVDGYFSASDSWQARADLPSPARQAHGGTALGGLGYAIGGQSASNQISDNDQYDPSGDAWTSRLDLPSPNRSFIGAVGVASVGKLFAFGGYHAAFPADFFYTQNDEYDPAGDSWSNKADMPSPGRAAPAYAEVGDKVYAWGGSYEIGGVETRIRDNDEFNPAGNSWASRTDTPTPARNKIQGGGSVAGKGYMIAGAVNNPGNQHQGCDDCDEYDPAGDSWTSKADSGLDRAFNAVTQTPDGLLHTFAGSHFTTFYSSSHQVYDPAADSWSNGQAVPSPQRTDCGAFAP